MSGVGFVAMKPQPGAYATVKEMTADPRKGWLMSASAVLSLRAGHEQRYPLMRRDAAAPSSPNCWQMPAGRCDLEELPLATACRELTEELGIRGAVQNWSATEVHSAGDEVTYQTATAVHCFQARWAEDGNTLEFYQTAP